MCVREGGGSTQVKGKTNKQRDRHRRGKIYVFSTDIKSKTKFLHVSDKLISSGMSSRPRSLRLGTARQ